MIKYLFLEQLRDCLAFQPESSGVPRRRMNPMYLGTDQKPTTNNGSEKKTLLCQSMHQKKTLHFFLLYSPSFLAADFLSEASEPSSSSCSSVLRFFAAGFLSSSYVASPSKPLFSIPLHDPHPNGPDVHCALHYLSLPVDLLQNACGYLLLLPLLRSKRFDSAGSCTWSALWTHIACTSCSNAANVEGILLASDHSGGSCGICHHTIQPPLQTPFSDQDWRKG